MFGAKTFAARLFAARLFARAGGEVTPEPTRVLSAPPTSRRVQDARRHRGNQGRWRA